MAQQNEGEPPTRAKEILQHYLDNPRTTDSLEGIASWSLLDELVQRRVRETDAALRWLVAHGFLSKVGGALAAPPLYRLNVDKVKDAERFVRGRDPARGEGSD